MAASCAASSVCACGPGWVTAAISAAGDARALRCELTRQRRRLGLLPGGRHRVVAPDRGAAQPQLAHGADHGHLPRALGNLPGSVHEVQAHRVDAVRDDARRAFAAPACALNAGRELHAGHERRDGRRVGRDDLERDRRRRRERVRDLERVVGAVPVGRDHRGGERERRCQRDRGHGRGPERGEQGPGALAGGVARIEAIGELRPRRDDGAVGPRPVPGPGDVAPAPAVARDRLAPRIEHGQRPARAAEDARTEGDRGEHAALVRPELRRSRARIDDLGRSDGLRRSGDRVELGIDERARAVGRERVAMAADDAEARALAGGIAIVAPRYQRRAAERIDVRDVEPPRDELRQGVAGRSGERSAAAVADHRDADAARVESAGLRADHRFVDPPCTPFEDPPVGVDQEVVANVVPAVRAHVVGVDRADDRGDVRGRIAVGRVGVMDEHHLGGGRVAGLGSLQRLVGAPARTRHDLGLIGRRLQRAQRPQRAPVGRHERDPDAPDGTANAQLQRVAAGKPDRLGVADRAPFAGIEPGPARPCRAGAPRPYVDGDAGQGAPARAEQVERERCPLRRQDVNARRARRIDLQLAVASGERPRPPARAPAARAARAGSGSGHASPLRLRERSPRPSHAIGRV